MINCPNCNNQVPEGTKFCPSCGAQIPEPTQNAVPQGAPVAHQGYVQGENPYQQFNNPQYPNVNRQTPYNQPNMIQEDKTNVGLCILSVFVPLFGIIYYFCTRQKKPREAKGCLKAGLISAGVSILLSIIITCVTVGGIFHIANKAIDEAGDYSAQTDDYDFSFDSDLTDEDDDLSVSEDSSSKSEAVPTDNMDNNWKNYKVSVNGTEISLPISYSDFTAKTGYVFKSEDDANSTLKKNYYNIVTLENGNSNVQVSIVNDGNEMKTQKDCKIMGISSYSYSTENSQVVYPGWLKAGNEISKEKINELFGKPDKEYEKDDYYVATYYEDYDKYYSQRKFEITISKGQIIDISLERKAS